MRKAIIALVIMAIATPAMAQHHRQPVRPQHQHHNHHRVNPWVAGAIGLGVLGAGAYYYNQRRSCWEEGIVDAYGRQIYNRYGQPLVQTVCN